MRNILRAFRATWRRPKHRGVTGNFSTVVIITGIVAGSWIMTGGEYPAVVPTYYRPPIQAVPLENQPVHSKEYAMTFRELRFRELPTPTPGGPPTDPDTCQKETISFLVDVSGSMLARDPSGVQKIAKVRDAIKAFATGLPDDAAVAIYSFSEPFDGIPGNGPGEQNLTEPDIPEPIERLFMQRYGDIKDDFGMVVDLLEPYPFAATYMREGFEESRTWLQLGKQEFPDYHQNLIFISDGVPETDVRGPNDQCLNEPICDRSYSPDQDPTRGTNLGDLIKSDGVDIYSVMIYTETESNIPELFSIFTGILKNVASEPNAPYYHESLNADSIGTVLNSIRSQICGV